MNKYNNGKIYRIVDNTNGDVYIGSTTKKYLSDRLSEHRCDYKRFLKGKKNNCRSGDIIKNGDFNIILIENYPCNSKKELTARERYFIENNKCINKVIPGRTNKEYVNDNKDRLNKIRRDNYDHEKNKINCKKDYEKHKQKRLDYIKNLNNYQKSFGGDMRSYECNLLKIDINLFH